MKDLPASLLQQLQGVTGFDERSFLLAHREPPVTSVRLNPAKNIGLFSGYEQVPWCTDGYYLPERPVFTLDPAFHAGAYYVQEASSMFLHHLLKGYLRDKKGIRVLDLCAAPGGKSTLLASILDRDSLLVSNEVIRTRASILEENMTRWGYANTWVTSNDPRDIGKLEGYFDVIVVDAPCSGSGLFRKDERALEEWSEANVALCGERQQRILADIWPALKEDGLLVYATCSYSPAEDEEILDWLASNYKVTPVTAETVTGWGITETVSVNEMTGYRFYPGKVKGEGFFIAAVQKKEEAGEIRTPKFRTVHDSKAQQQAAHLLSGEDRVIFQPSKEDYHTIASIHEADWHILHKSLYLRKVGINIGSPAGKDWIPAHDVALSTDRSSSIPIINVNKEQALKFLKREDMGIADIPKGWQLIGYNGLGLGWVKSLGNRVNNYLPKHWRIRMDISDADLS